MTRICKVISTNDPCDPCHPWLIPAFLAVRTAGAAEPESGSGSHLVARPGRNRPHTAVGATGATRCLPKRKSLYRKLLRFPTSLRAARNEARQQAVRCLGDRRGAYLDADPVTPGDLAATLFGRFGLDAGSVIRDLTGRPYRLASARLPERSSLYYLLSRSSCSNCVRSSTSTGWALGSWIKFFIS